MPADLWREAYLLVTECRGFSIEEGIVDAAFELVHIHRVDELLKTAVLTLELGDRFIPELRLVAMAPPWFAGSPSQHIRPEPDPLGRG
jgi:hypothetical protein